MNQEQNNLNQNNFNIQGNNEIPNNQPLQDNQSFNSTFNQNVAPNTNINQPTFNSQLMAEPMQQPAHPQQIPSYQQPIMQEPTPQPVNPVESGNTNYQNLNSKPPKKTNLGLIIGIVAVVAVIGVIIGIFVFSDNRGNLGGLDSSAQNIQYFSSLDKNIIEKIDINGKSYIDIPAGKGLLITDDKENVIDITSEIGNYNIQNIENNYYYFSLLEYFVNVESSIIYKDYVYKYNFKVKFNVVDPIKMMDKISINGSISSTEIFKGVFDEILKVNLNNFIMNYIEENNITLDDLYTSNVGEYLSEKIQEKVEESYYGVKFSSIVLQSITKSEIQHNNNKKNKEFFVGDKIKFNNENWYVIENSSEEKDYVVVLKEKALNKRMKFFENFEDNYPFSSTDTRFYEKSEVKKYLENEYINELGDTNLKEINGYKIRLITVEELCNNLIPNSQYINFYEEKNSRGCYLYHEENTNVAPEWVYLTSIVGTDNYWTMSYAYGSGNYQVNNYIETIGTHVGAMVSGSRESEMETEKGIRPVINLLKNNIE